MNTNIKKRLKEYGITLTIFAQKLNISRPTLDMYIETYESGFKIKQKKYQTIFNTLFDNDITSSDFHRQLEQFSRMINREKLLGMIELEPEDSDTLMRLFFKMIGDFKTTSCNKDIYAMIGLIIDNYRNSNEIKDVTNYFLTINLLNDYNKLSSQNQYIIASYHKMFKEFEKNRTKLFLPRQEIDEFKKYLSELKKDKEEKEKYIKKEIEKIVLEKLQTLKKSGKNIDNLSANEILEIIKEN